MGITFSNNPIDKLLYWFENEVIDPISRYYYSKKKSHYQCAICGRIEAPYFTGEKYASITKDMGWHKLDNGKWHRWVCHHCADHGFERPNEKDLPWTFTWDEWQDFVEEDNNKLLTTIKEKDPEYYEYWFNGGRERELFQECDD